MDKSIQSYTSSHPILTFACVEWNRLLNTFGETTAERLREVWIGTWGELEARLPQLLEENGYSEWKESVFSDEFIIIETENRLILSGKSERASLYAVYQYAQEAWGLHAIYPGEQGSIAGGGAFVKKSKNTDDIRINEQLRHYAPRLERRGFVFETVNDPQYLKAMIDWFGHNKINELFFTFSLWDQVGEALTPEITKRGITITLGGHSMKFFLNKGDNQVPDTVADHPYTAKAQLNFRDSQWQATLLQDIANYCRNVPNLTRVSMWPEDIADRQAEGFLEHYILFTEKLDAYLRKSGLVIEVEHIAYNAGLAWNMLEDSEAKPSKTVDTLFAFWGRDYRYGYDNSPHESDRRAKESLKDWTLELQRTDRKLTIFEYYSDHYMLSTLFPFLPQRILDDVAYFEKQGVFGIVNLVVPYNGLDPYPWKWVHGFNSYVCCKALWSNNLEAILDDYYTYYPENERASVRALFQVIEAKLAGITSWNVPLFPARAVDPEKAKANKEQKEMILASLEDIRGSIQTVMRQSGLPSDREPYQYAQHIVDYTGMLHRRWTDQ